MLHYNAQGKLVSKLFSFNPADESSKLSNAFETFNAFDDKSKDTKNESFRYTVQGSLLRQRQIVDRYADPPPAPSTVKCNTTPVEKQCCSLVMKKPVCPDESAPKCYSKQNAVTTVKFNSQKTACIDSCYYACPPPKPVTTPTVTAPKPVTKPPVTVAKPVTTATTATVAKPATTATTATVAKPATTATTTTVAKPATTATTATVAKPATTATTATVVKPTPVVNLPATGLAMQQQAASAAPGSLEALLLNLPMLKFDTEFDKDRGRFHYSTASVEQMQQNMIDDGSHVTVPLWKINSTNMVVATSKHVAVFFDKTADVPEGLFQHVFVKPFLPKVAKDMGLSMDNAKRIKWVHELLYNMEDWFMRCTVDWGFTYKNTINVGEFRNVPAKLGILVSSEVRTNNPPYSSDGGMFQCSACAANMGYGIVNVNVNWWTARGFPISGGVTHEFGHAIGLNALQAYSESFGNFFIVMQILEAKDVDPKTIGNISYFWRLSDACLSMGCTPRYRYHDPYIFVCLHENWDNHQYKHPATGQPLEPQKAVGAWIAHAKQKMWGQPSSADKLPGDMWDTLGAIVPVPVGEWLAKYYARLCAVDVGRCKVQLMDSVAVGWFAHPLRDLGDQWLNGVYYELVPVPDRPGRLKVGDYRAPQQTGFVYTLLRASPSGGPMRVTIHALYDAVLGSGFSAVLVRIPLGNRALDPEYSKVVTAGQADATLELAGPVSPDDHVILVVVAAPQVFNEFSWLNHDAVFHPTLTTAKMRHPFELTLQNCERVVRSNINFVKLKHKSAAGPFRKHPNGGGSVLVSNTQVASTAYIGPDAFVINGVVKDNARILDYSIVLNGTVQDNAIMSGHSWLSNGTLQDNARMRDQASMVKGLAKDDARLMECSGNEGTTVQNNGTSKGVAYLYALAKVSNSAIMEGDYFSFWGGEMTHGAWTGHERGQFYEADASQTKYIANNNKWYVHYAFQRFTSLQTFDTYFGCTYALARNGATYLPNGAGLQLSAGARQYLLLNDTTLDIRRTKIAVGLVPSAQNAQNAGLITMGSYSTGFLTVSFVGKSLEATILTIQAGNVMRQVAQTAQVGKLEAGQQYLVNVVWEAAPTFAVTLTVGTGAAGDNPVSATMAAPCAMYDLYKHDSRMLCAYGRHPNDIVPTFDGVLKLVAVGFL